MWTCWSGPYLLASQYAQMSVHRRGAGQSDFESFVDDWLDPERAYHVDGIRLDCSLFRSALIDALGEENVLVTPYEWMAEDPAGVLESWLTFLCTAEPVEELLREFDEAKRLNARSIGPSDAWRLRDFAPPHTNTIRLRGRRVLRHVGLPDRIRVVLPDFFREKRIRLTPRLRERILHRYAESNRRFAESIGMDLERYGYY